MNITTPKIKVLILGLRQDQRALIEREYSDRFDLRFFKPEHHVSIARLRNMLVPDITLVLCMVKFIDHASINMVKNRLPKAFRSVYGGIDILRAVLNNIQVSRK